MEKKIKLMSEHVYQDRKYCIEQLAEIWKSIASSGLTHKEASVVQDALSLMYVYCPEDLMDMVEYYSEELDYRLTNAKGSSIL
jgi:hypothetical protein